jgi:hypothetical protein
MFFDVEYYEIIGFKSLKILILHHHHHHHHHRDHDDDNDNHRYCPPLFLFTSKCDQAPLVYQCGDPNFQLHQVVRNELAVLHGGHIKRHQFSDCGIAISPQTQALVKSQFHHRRKHR